MTNVGFKKTGTKQSITTALCPSFFETDFTLATGKKLPFCIFIFLTKTPKSAVQKWQNRVHVVFVCPLIEKTALFVL